MGISEKPAVEDMHVTMHRLYQAAEELRGLRGQAEVARYMKVSPQMLNNWESRGMSKGGMLTAQEKIGCSALWLKTGKGEKAVPWSALNDHSELLEAWGYLLPAEKESVMEQVRSMAAHNKAVLAHCCKSSTT